MELPEGIQGLVDKCNPKHVKVVQAIVSGEYSSNTAAYMSVYTETTEESARRDASRMLTNADVEELLGELRKIHILKNIITREESLQVLSDMARTHMGDIVEFGDLEVGEDEDGEPIVCSTWRFKGSKHLNQAALHSIHEVSSSAQGLKIKQHDQKAAIKQLAEMLGWNATKEVKVTGLEFVGDILSRKDSD